MTTQLNIIPDGNYLPSVRPRIIPMYSTENYATITTAGFLDDKCYNPIYETDLIHANYGDGQGFFTVSISDGVKTLAPLSNPGEVSLIGAAVTGNLPKFANTTGDISDSGASLSSAQSKIAAVNGATVIGDLAGFSDTSGTLVDVSNTITDYQQFVSLTNILINSVGTWTRTRVAEGNYSLVHTPANDTSIIGIDITPQLRAATNKGFKLASIDVIYSIGTLALDAHTWTLDTVSYANNVAVSVVSAGAGSLSTATQANPYVTNIEPITPAFLNTACAKYVFELTVDAAATGLYSFYGLNLHFSKTIT